MPTSVTPSREEMLKRVAFFKELKGITTGFVDSEVPGCTRTLYNVIGPGHEEGGIEETAIKTDPTDGPIVDDPIGRENARKPAIAIAEGFHMGFAECKPGNGTLLHDHDTNETFVVMSGRWKFYWGDKEEESVELGQSDILTFPPGVPRRFVNVTEGQDDVSHLLLAVLMGNTPKAIILPEVLHYALENGRPSKYNPH